MPKQFSPLFIALMSTKEFIHSLIQIAQSDFEASKILYDSGFYLQSTFYLQQGVEKANKAFGLFGKFLEPADSKQLSHDHIKLHKKAINHQLEKVKIFDDKRVELKPFLDIVKKELDFDYAKYSQTLESARHIKDEMKDFDFVTTTEEELLDSIEQIQSINTGLDLEIDKETLIEELKGKPIEFVISLFHSLKETNPNINIVEVEEFFRMPETLEVMAETMVKIIDFQNRLCSPSLKIYMLGFITMELVTVVRYPDIDKNPIKIFTAEHPIIKHQPKLHYIASAAFEELVLLMKEHDNLID